MKDKYKIIILTLLFIINCFGKGQTQNNTDYAPRDYSIVPPSPSVSNLMDIQNYPMTNNRGVPDISFTLFTLKSGTISVPIVLTYQDGGIRSNQKSGNAGLGWTVVCGASIGHTVYGAPDDAHTAQKIHGLWHLNSSEKSFRQKLIEKRADYDPTDGSNYMENLAWEAIDGNRYFHGLTDIANDMYSLCGLGMSATFAYDENKKIIISSDEPLEIVFNNQNAAVTDGGCDGMGYRVKDRNGLTYDFLTQERTKYIYKYGNPAMEQMIDSVYYASAWHIDQISDLTGNKVNFKYDNAQRKRVDDLGNSRNEYISVDEYQHVVRRHIHSCSSVEYFPKILESISANGVTVNFKYRHKYFGNFSVPLISDIIIESPDAKRVIHFNYDDLLRMALTSVTDQDEEIYRFEYETDNKGYVDYYLDSQDFGGYNNDIDNGTLIPTVANYGEGANRSVVPDAAKLGTLKKISYPTGGYTQFIWESNTFSKVEGRNYVGGSLNDPAVRRCITDTIRMCMDVNFKKLKLDNYVVAQRQSIVLDLTRYFLMNPANYTYGDYQNSHAYAVENYSMINPPNYPHVRFINKKTNKVSAVYFLDKETIETKWQNKPFVVPLAPGTYTIELLNPLSVTGTYDFLEANMRYKDSLAGRIYIYKNIYSSTGSDGSNYWCGLRIRRIVSSTGDSAEEPIRKDFYYNTAFSPHETTGNILRLPQYDYQYYKTVAVKVGALGYQVNNVFCVGESAFPGVPGSTYSNIAYSDVATNLTKEDRFEPNPLNEIREFLTFSESSSPECADYNRTQFLGFQPIGSRMYSSRAFRRGDLINRRSSYRVSGNGLSTDYEYNIYEKDELPTLTTDAFVVCDFTTTPGINKYASYDYSIGVYNLIPYNKTIKSKITCEGDGISQRQNYTYFYDSYTDKLDYNLVKSMSQTLSEYGDSMVTHYTYLRGESNYFPLPETEVTVIGDRVVSAKRTEYDSQTHLPQKVFEMNGRHNVAELISSTQASTTNQTRLIATPTYEYKYNSNGNLVEIKYKGKVLASYLWGYNGLYPIIEATNTTYEDLVSHAMSSGMTADNIALRSVATQQKVRDVAYKLRISLPQSEITSIAYHWLLGVIEMTDSRGISTAYGYDSRGRLTSSRDFNNCLLSRHQYHYSQYNYYENE